MGKLAILFALGVLVCAIEQSSGNGDYYWAYPGAQSGAYAYPAPYQPYQQYQQYPQLAPYAAFVPIDCDENKVADEGSDSSSSSSSSSSSEESSDSSDSSSSSSEEEAKPEEGGEATESGEATEGESGAEEGSSEGSAESSSSSSESSSSESKSKEEEKKKKKEEKPVSLFPPVAYNFPARPVQQYVYSAPISQFMPFRTYSAVQQQPAYPVKSINSYYGAAPFSGGYNARVVSGPMNGPTVVKGYAPVTRLVSSAVTRVVQSPVSYVPSSAAYTYWNPSGNLGYYKK